MCFIKLAPPPLVANRRKLQRALFTHFFRRGWLQIVEIRMEVLNCVTLTH